MKKVTKKELGKLWQTVDNEGFGYYMIQYGADLDLIERLGFDKTDVSKAIVLLRAIKDKIDEGEEWCEEE